jgi:hypothetical protein
MANDPIILPPGVSVAPGRETSQAGPTGAIIQGMLFTLTLANGAQTSIFIPYILMNNTAEIEALFAQRVAQINAVSNIGS